MTNWLSDALRTTTATDRALQIVTPPTTRLTLPTRTALRGLPNRWVVQDPEHGYYDGLSGAVLHWRNGTFTLVHDDNGTTRIAEAFTATADSGDHQLILILRTRHAADADLVLGRALETAFRHLTVAPPSGWSTAEPINLPWTKEEFTDLARARAPRPTWLIAIDQPNRPALATIRVLRTSAGVEEDITPALGYGGGETRPWRPSRNSRPSLELPSIPLAFTLEHDEDGRIDTARVERPAQGPTPVRLGSAFHYRLGNGSDAEAWTTFQRLTQHLKQQA
ncbi:DUF6177 family protein [Streptomyces werraensis]|uniref:DUF6177 family protein n=1 Tax=Streptomyces werraensis TaxID=68284 RepID=UPI0037D508A7